MIQKFWNRLTSKKYVSSSNILKLIFKRQPDLAPDVLKIKKNNTESYKLTIGQKTLVVHDNSFISYEKKHLRNLCHKWHIHSLDQILLPLDYLQTWTLLDFDFDWEKWRREETNKSFLIFLKRSKSYRLCRTLTTMH